MSHLSSAYEAAKYHRDRATSPALRDYWQRVMDSTASSRAGDGNRESPDANRG